MLLKFYAQRASSAAHAWASLGSEKYMHISALSHALSNADRPVPCALCRWLQRLIKLTI